VTTKRISRVNKHVYVEIQGHSEAQRNFQTFAVVLLKVSFYARISAAL